MRVTVPTRGSMNLKANVGFVLKSDLLVMLSARISTQEYPYVEIYVSGSKDLILIRFFFWFHFPIFSFVFSVADYDHQWSVCCH